MPQEAPRSLANSALHFTEGAFFQSLLQHWPGAFFRQQPDLSCEFVSAGLAALTGVPLKTWQQESGIFLKIIHEEDVEHVKAHINLCRQLPFGAHCTFRVRHASTGRVRTVSEYRCRVHDQSQLAGYDCAWLDGGQTAAAEKRFVSASWKETVGLMTMGLAHDYNNVLAGMLSFTELFLAQIDASHPFHEGLTLIRQNAEKGAQIIQRIVQLHTAKFGRPAYHDLNEVLKDTLDLLRKAIPRRIAVSSQTATEALPVFVDPLELRQVISNFAMNAAEAMLEGGKLLFETSLRKDPPNLGCFVGVAPRLPCVCLAVTDTGCGIAPGDLHRLFEPFFTTKFANQGTGLGLHTARMFAEKNRGAISVESIGGSGTTFRLWLPQCDFTEQELAMRLARQRPRRLLLAGENPTTLKTLASACRESGFDAVAGGTDAQDILMAGEQLFDALVVAVEAEDKKALALASEVKRQKVPLKIVILYGGSGHEQLETEYFGRADLMLPLGLSAGELVRQIAGLFE